MKIKIVGVYKNTEGKEYLMLQANENINLRHFAVTDNTFDDKGDVSNKQRHFFKFPSIEILKNQKIALFSRPINATEGSINSSNVVIFSWKLNHDVWNNDGDKVVIMEISDYDSKIVN